MKNELLPIQPGTAVRVSDGAPRPPERFKRKLADWENKNFDAVVTGEEPAGKYGRAEHVYRLQFGDLSKRGWMVMFTTRPPHMVKPIEGAPKYRLEMRGLDYEVVGIEGGA